ncbi:hypothetical protein PVT68_16815 [Microbulbifer bruguierae]|uniref:Lipoprotein n=1 Tax=Microbulbifer bruguierae TaxID=3029061 RepID=A0ABY8NDA1_9GAMM|nr:hypothetical protein [Microbulbifer bruguierae]WGL16414.1 hypothetical protein PVT68_16815 [Microbulbifer bruguierae]
MFIRYIATISALLALTGCASKPSAPNPGLKESFHTEISANGSKRFTYSLESAIPAIPGPFTERPSMGGNMPSGVGMAHGQRRQMLDFDHALDLKLKETRFCRDGYFVIDRVVSRQGGEVRGECRDALSRE